MYTLRGYLLGTLAGAAAGTAAGCLIAGRAVMTAFHAWPTVWRDCGPLVFIPLVIGTASGLSARLKRGEISGLFLSVVAGACSGIAAPPLYQRAFGAPYPVPAGFASMLDMFPFLLAVAGAVAAIVWRFSVDRVID